MAEGVDKTLDIWGGVLYVGKVYDGEQIRKAVTAFKKLKSYQKTCDVLGYSTTHTLRVCVEASRKGGRKVLL